MFHSIIEFFHGEWLKVDAGVHNRGQLVINFYFYLPSFDVFCATWFGVTSKLAIISHVSICNKFFPSFLNVCNFKLSKCLQALRYIGQIDFSSMMHVSLRPRKMLVLLWIWVDGDPFLRCRDLPTGFAGTKSTFECRLSRPDDRFDIRN